MLKHKRLN